MEQMHVTLIILVIAMILFITEFVSYTATALFVPITLYLTGVLDATEIVFGLTNGGVLLCAAMFIIGGTLLSSGLAKSVGHIITVRFKKERSAMLTLMLTSIVLSSFIGNMGSATVMVTLAIGVCQTKKEMKLSKLLMAIAFGCSLGGMNTLVGTPPNLLARSYLVENNLGTIGFFEFAKIGIPMGLVGLIYMYFIGYKLSPLKDINIKNMSSSRESNLTDKKSQFIIGVVFIGVIIGMALEQIIKIPVHITAFTGVLILLFSKTIDDKQAYNYIQWPAVYLVAGMLPLANAMTKTDAADFIANSLIDLIGQNVSMMMLIAVLFMLALVLTQTMSNTASTALLIPIAASVSTNLGLNPLTTIMAVLVGAQCAFITPIATPHNTYIMGIAKYKFTDFVKIGLPMAFLSLIVILVILPIFWLF
ncbi:MAG: SLC13 family permease [Eubacteriales bacterium]